MTQNNPQDPKEEIPLSVAEELFDLPEEESQEEPQEAAPEEPEQNLVQALQEELAKSKDQTLRALAELENYRKRSSKEREDAGSYAISKFARELLDVSDNLRRALDAAPEGNEELSGLLTGIEATERELLKVFSQNGIQKIEPLEEKFDPNFHEVMFEAPMPGKPNGTIIQVIEAGYVLRGRLLRPARVGVAKNADEPPPGQDGHLVDEEA